MSNDSKIFRPNMKLVGTDGAVDTDEELTPSTFKFILKNGTEIVGVGFLAVTSSFIAVMDTEDKLAVVVPMTEIQSVVKAPEIAGAA